MDLPSIGIKITEDGKKYLEEINKQLGVPITLLWVLSAVLGKVRGGKAPEQPKKYDIGKVALLPDEVLAAIIAIAGDEADTFNKAVHIAERYASTGVYYLYKIFKDKKEEFTEHIVYEALQALHSDS